MILWRLTEFICEPFEVKIRENLPSDINEESDNFKVTTGWFLQPVVLHLDCNFFSCASQCSFVNLSNRCRFQWLFIEFYQKKYVEYSIINGTTWVFLLENVSSNGTPKEDSMECLTFLKEFSGQSWHSGSNVFLYSSGTTTSSFKKTMHYFEIS